MLDIGWSEMLVIAAIAIVVIGPKDLPAALRAIGRWVAKARAAAREFQSGIDQMVADAELDELKKTATSVRDFDAESLLDKVDPTGADEKGPTGASPTSGGDQVAAGEPAAGSADGVAAHIDDAESGARIADEIPPAQVAPPHSLMHAGQAVDYMPPSEEEADDRGERDGAGDGDADAPSSAGEDAATPRRAGGADA